MLREVIACFPVYRTYIEAESGRISDRDRQYIDEAIEAAKRNRPEIDADLFDFFRDLLQLRVTRPARVEAGHAVPAAHRPGDGQGRRGHGRSTTTTAWSRSTRSAATPAGSDSRSTTSTRPAARPRNAGRPTMLASTTHDTKRSEDVRARIALLSEIPEAWAEAVERWAAAQRAAQARRHARPQPRVPPLPDARRRLADRASSGSTAYHDEGRARGQGVHVLEHPEPGLRGGASTRSSRHSWPTTRSSTTSRASSRR